MAKRVGFWAGECLGFQAPGVDLGEMFALWVSLDAFVVLSGAVLTAYVGISGLIARMAKDRCLPQFMLRKVSFQPVFCSSCSLLTVFCQSQAVPALILSAFYRNGC